MTNGSAGLSSSVLPSNVSPQRVTDRMDVSSYRTCPISNSSAGFSTLSGSADTTPSFCRAHYARYLLSRYLLYENNIARVNTRAVHVCMHVCIYFCAQRWAIILEKSNYTRASQLGDIMTLKNDWTISRIPRIYSRRATKNSTENLTRCALANAFHFTRAC